MCTPQDIVQAALSRNLDAVAITDHNTAGWIEGIQQAAKGTPLVVFPGVEISCTGGKKCVHIIAIFDPDKTYKHVEALLNVLAIGPDHYGNQDAVTDKGPVEVIQLIDKNGGLAVLAHANSSNGVLSDMAGQPRINVIKCKQLLAAEGTDFGDAQKRDNHKRVVDLLDGKDPTYQRQLAVYQASDNPCGDGSGRHCLGGIGARTTYFKVEKINLEALRQCFIDPQTRILSESTLQPLVYPRLKRVKINSGFLEGQEIEFHDGLTTILGAKGAGKSLLIEFARFALNQEPQSPSIAQDHVLKLRSKLGEYGTVEVTFVDESGAETTLARTLREIDGSPYPDDVPYNPAQIFPALFLSQNEIIKIAEDETEQLQFIDQFFDFRAYRAKIGSLEHELEQLDKAMAERLGSYRQLADLSTRIATAEKEVQRLDRSLADPIFDKFKLLQAKDNALSHQRDYLASLVDRVGQARDSLIGQAVPTIPAALKSDPMMLRASDAVRRVHEKLAEQLSRLVADLARERDQTEAEHNTWHPQYLAAKREYEESIQKMGGDYKALAQSRERLVRELADLNRKRASAEARRDEVPEIARQRNELLDNLEEQYTQYTNERRAKCLKFQEDSAGKLTLRILGSSNVDEFRANLLSLKRGSYLRDEEIGLITANVAPRDFVISLLRYDATKESKHLDKAARASGIDLARMKTLADFLLETIPYEQLLALQHKAIPQDRPEILYDVGNGNYQSLAAVSVGQKCTAMLIMALSDGSMPIIIDQPEDSLDIRSIWDDICTKIRTGKNRRQFIFTTHNSSLAVASDTDCYLILEGDASHGRIIHYGAMDHDPMASQVLTYLEGGRDTYQLKFAKYGNPGGT